MSQEKQKTIKHSVSVSGVGLHTGKVCTLTFTPAKEDYGIKFQRVAMEWVEPEYRERLMEKHREVGPMSQYYDLKTISIPFHQHL